MKAIIYGTLSAVSLCLAGVSTSCSDGVSEVSSNIENKTELKVYVEGLQQTRTLITGSTLPEGSRFALFYDSPYSVGVSYESGECTLDSAILLDGHAGDTPVYALYPYVKGKEQIINTHEYQMDYLRGISVDSKGLVTYPSVEHPEARIMFDHILARITVNIHKEESVDNTYDLRDIFLGGDDDNAYRSAKYFPWGDYFEYTDKDPDKNIYGELKDGNSLLASSEDMVTVDFLVLPCATAWSLRIRELTDDWILLPECDYKSGRQYVYDCIIKLDEQKIPYLTVSTCVITPWDPIEMPEVDAEGY